jgi:LuxR family transcriptional regulator, maltose regulon positive regulatory protein
MRLFQKLDRGIEYGFVLISAPAGYGKSTLVSDWLRHAQHHALWLSLDEKDNELARFLAYLAAVVRVVDVPGSEALESALHVQPQPEIEAILTPFINQLAQSAHQICLVLDDYHLIQNQSIHQALGFLLEHRPPALLVMLLTRADPPLKLAKFRAHSGVLEIRQADLCFTLHEAADFLTHTIGLDLSAEDVERLTIRTEGWIAGLQMAGLSLLDRANPADFIRAFSGENHFILDFLFEEVFQSQPEEIQSFLLKTSILSQFCASSCDAVTESINSRRLLQTLEMNNLFLIPMDSQQHWFRYHHLFRDLLRARLNQASPEQIAPLHQHASAWYAANNDLESAVEHALAGQDFEFAACLIESAINQIEVLNKLPVISSWLDALPHSVVESHPWLGVYCGWVDFETGLREAGEQNLQVLEKSLETVLEANDPQKSHIHGHIAALRAYAAICREDIPYALEMGQKALALLPEDDRMRSSAANALGAAYWASGDVVKTEQAFRAAREAGLRISPMRGAPATTYIGIQQVKQGQLWGAAATFGDALQLATLPNGIETPLAGFAKVKLGDVLREQNNLSPASEHLTKGLALCKQLGQIDVLVDACVCMGRYHLLTGDLNSTQEMLQYADRSARQSVVDEWLLCWLDDLRIKTWLATGNLDAARAWSRNSGLSSTGPFSYQHDLHHQNLARVLVAEGILAGSGQALRKAEPLLEELIELATQAGWVHEQIILLVLQSKNYQALGQKEYALQSLARAVLLAEPGGYVRVFMDEGEKIRTLLIALRKIVQNPDADGLEYQSLAIPGVKRDPFREYIFRLLAAFDLAVDQAGSQSPRPIGVKTMPVATSLVTPLAEPLSRREMDVLKLLAQGFSDKQIAESLVIARETVHKHLKNIYGKLDVHNRTEAVSRARELGML